MPPSPSVRPQPEQVLGYSDAVYIAYKTDEMVEKCVAALGEPDNSKTEARIAYGKACSWDARVREIEAILRKKKIFEEKK